MKFSVCIEMIFGEFTFEERIKKVFEIGLPAIEFWDWRSKDIEIIKREKEKYGLEISAFCGNKKAPLADPDKSDDFIKDIKESINIAHILECKRLIITTGNTINNLSRAKQWESVVNGLSNVSEIAEKEEITLLLEPLNTLVDHPNYFLDSSEDGFEIIREVNSNNVKILFDIYHHQIMDGNLISTISKNIDMIGHFHVADVPGRYEPGTGEINYKNILDKVNELGFEEYIGLEFRPSKSSNESLKSIIQLLENRSKDYFKRKEILNG